MLGSDADEDVSWLVRSDEQLIDSFEGHRLVTDMSDNEDEEGEEGQTSRAGEEEEEEEEEEEDEMKERKLPYAGVDVKAVVSTELEEEGRMMAAMQMMPDAIYKISVQKWLHTSQPFTFPPPPLPEESKHEPVHSTPSTHFRHHIHLPPHPQVANLCTVSEQKTWDFDAFVKVCEMSKTRV